MDQLSVKITGQQIACLESPGGRGSQDDRVGFARTLGAADAIVADWSLGGHIAPWE